MVVVKSEKSKSEQNLAMILQADGYSFERQFKFHPERQFKADFLIHGPAGGAPEGKASKLIVEVDGGKKGKPGRHQRVDGIDYDCRRAADAILLGYTVLRVSRAMIYDNTVSKILKQYFEVL